MGKFCKETKRDGTQCGSYAIKGTERCFWHSKDTIESKKEAQKAGGRVTGKRLSEIRKEKDKVRARMAVPHTLKINDWQDLKEYCERKLDEVPPQFTSWFLNALTKCIEHLADQNIVHFVVYVDPLLPNDPIPPLPELPDFDFLYINDETA